MLRLIAFSVLVLALSQDALAQCPNGRCPNARAILSLSAASRPVLALPGQPVRKAAQGAATVAATAVRGAAKAAVLPVRVIRQAQPVRRILRATAKVVTGRGPLLSRLRGGRCCGR